MTKQTFTVQFFDKLSGKVVYELAMVADNTEKNRCRALNAAYKVGNINFADPYIAHRFVA